MLATLGVILAGALMAKRVQGAMLISIFVLTVVGMFTGLVPQPTSIHDIISFDLPSLSGTFMALDIMAALEFGLFSIIFTFTIVELFDNMGTFCGSTFLRTACRTCACVCNGTCAHSCRCADDHGSACDRL